MGRHKRQQLKPCHSYGLARAVPRTEPLSHSANQKPKRVAPQHNAPAIPFSPDDHILLVGEGDLSFARALVQSLGCLHVTATVLEKNRVELEEKYSHVGTIIDEIENDGGKVEFGVDARRMRRWDINVDAKAKVKIGVMDKIVFNFPHVGGKSTDVNRQVRYNQELLVSFFKTGMHSLAPSGSIIVTLFEGEPYTLWNIRDLARHCGLQVERSFKFQASAYPGYHHVRTLGIVKSKNGQAGAGWKGEDRPARSYIFIRKGEGIQSLLSKRKRDEDSNDDGD